MMALVALPTTVAGKAGRFYYNRPNATVVNLDMDTKACVDRSKGGTTIATVGIGRSPASATANGALGGLAVGLFMILDAAKQRRFVDECLSIKGWRQILLSDQQAAQLEKSIRDDRNGALTPIVGAIPVSFGSLGPVWRNSYAQPHIVIGKAQ